MTTDDAPLPLTPYPRPRHIIRLRQARERRRKRISLGATLAIAVLAVGAGTAAYGADSAVTRAEAGPVQLATGDVADNAAHTLRDAKSLVKRAKDVNVDASHLTGYVDYLEDYDGMPAAVASDATDETKGAISALEDDVSKAEKKQKREEERTAREKEEAERKAEEARRQQAAANTVDGAKNTARQVMADSYGWGDDQFGCLDALWTKESGWNYQASNPSSGAYGIPQALPGSKMGTVAADWQTNAGTQVAWGLDYISRAYGTPCAAWGHSQAMNWY